MRADFPYRKEGRRAPDRPPEAAGRGARRAGRDRRRRVVVGGRSMGGRMCSMVAGGADGEPPPPKRRRASWRSAIRCTRRASPTNLRVEHLPAITVPCLFVHGDQGPVRHARRARALDGDDRRSGDAPLDRRRAPRPQGRGRRGHRDRRRLAGRRSSDRRCAGRQVGGTCGLGGPAPWARTPGDHRNQRDGRHDQRDDDALHDAEHRLDAGPSCRAARSRRRSAPCSRSATPIAVYSVNVPKRHPPEPGRDRHQRADQRHAPADQHGRRRPDGRTSARPW